LHEKGKQKQTKQESSYKRENWYKAKQHVWENDAFIIMSADRFYDFQKDGVKALRAEHRRIAKITGITKKY
jgi:hypothetical protein